MEPVVGVGDRSHHTHCDCWPECCCWCGIGLEEPEQNWQNIEWTPRDITVMARRDIADVA